MTEEKNNGAAEEKNIGQMIIKVEEKLLRNRFRNSDNPGELIACIRKLNDWTRELHPFLSLEPVTKTFSSKFSDSFVLRMAGIKIDKLEISCPPSDRQKVTEKIKESLINYCCNVMFMKMTDNSRSVETIVQDLIEKLRKSDNYKNALFTLNELMSDINVKLSAELPVSFGYRHEVSPYAVLRIDGCAIAEVTFREKTIEEPDFTGDRKNVTGMIDTVIRAWLGISWNLQKLFFS